MNKPPKKELHRHLKRLLGNQERDNCSGNVIFELKNNGSKNPAKTFIPPV